MEVSRALEILEVKTNASFDEAKQAYRDMINVWHPDKYANNERLQEKATEKLKEVNAAWEELQKYYHDKDGQSARGKTDNGQQQARQQQSDQARRQGENRKQADSGRQEQKQKVHNTAGKVNESQRARLASEWPIDSILFGFKLLMFIVEILVFVKACYLVRHSLLTSRVDNNGYVGFILMFLAIVILPVAQSKVASVLERLSSSK